MRWRGLKRRPFPYQHAHPGELVALDGSLIDAVLSMTWADHGKNSKKAKIHSGFNLNVELGPIGAGNKSEDDQLKSCLNS